MKPVVGRFAIAAGAFVLWLGYLAYLALTAAQPTVLSRPQFLVAEFTVLASLHGPFDDPTEVTIAEVFGPHGNTHSRVTGLPAPASKIRITNLNQCKGFLQAGDYILPLVQNADGLTYRVVPVPLSPGSDLHLAGRPSKYPPYLPVIYPLTANTREQLQTLVASP